MFLYIESEEHANHNTYKEWGWVYSSNLLDFSPYKIAVFAFSKCLTILYGKYSLLKI